MKGFKLLETACKDLTHKLADSEEKVRSGEQAYTALEEKIRSNEASYTELVLKMGDQIRSYEAAFKELISQAREKICIDAAAYAAEVSRMEEKLQVSELAYSRLAEKMEECESTLKSRESVRFVLRARTLELTNIRVQDLNSLRDTIQQSVTCGICQSIPTQPCRCDSNPHPQCQVLMWLIVLTAVTSFVRCVYSAGGKPNERTAALPVERLPNPLPSGTLCKGSLHWHAHRLVKWKNRIHLTQTYLMLFSYRKKKH